LTYLTIKNILANRYRTANFVITIKYCKEEIPMVRTMLIILSLAFLALGILGIVGIVPMLKNDQLYVNIGEIVLGGLGLLVGLFTRKKS
jgi:hypothetical protein